MPRRNKDEGDEQEFEGEDLGRFVPAVYARDVDEALELQELLEDHDILVKIGEEDEDDRPRKTKGKTIRKSAAARGVPVLVPEEMLEEAREIIAERNEIDEFDDVDDEVEDEDDDEDAEAGEKDDEDEEIDEEFDIAEGELDDAEIDETFEGEDGEEDEDEDEGENIEMAMDEGVEEGEEEGEGDEGEKGGRRKGGRQRFSKHSQDDDDEDF